MKRLGFAICAVWMSGCTPPHPVGLPGWEVIEAPTVQSRLPADELEWLSRNLQVSPKAELVDGRYLVVAGCRSHLCTMVEGLAVIDTKGDGWMVARTEGGGNGVMVSRHSSWSNVLPDAVAALKDRWIAGLRPSAQE